ncbi:MAG TPA: alpha/beta fold hydrolase [Thermoanaerobaculia bacterium]
MRHKFVLVGAVALLGSTLGAAETNRFRLQVGASMSGTDEYTIARTADGFVVAGNSRRTAGGQTIEMKLGQNLAPDRSLRRYALQTTTPSGQQTVDALRDGGTVEMKVVATGSPRSRKVPFTPGAVLLDNLVTAHFQLLLDQIGGKPPTEPMTFLVPQALVAVPGKVALEGEEAGTLDGKPVRVKKYSIELPGVLELVWAEAEANLLMRVEVPLQKVEMVREGFALAPKVSSPPAGPAAPLSFTERDLKFPSGSLSFPATLCLPAGAKGKVPVVVLVHGSGAHDRDETIGPNKPFRDLARGLAAEGIATLRYEKRTHAFLAQINPSTLTLDDETIDDAVAALAFARTLPEADPGKVFILGHSQGATFSPVIAERGKARGAILMAAMERPVDQTIQEQIAFQGKRAGKPDEEIAKQVDGLKKTFARVRSGEAPDQEMVFLANALYWRSFLSHDTLAELRRLQAPVLLLQGGKDVQVLKVDYDLARQALAGKAPEMAEAHWFPDLNHLFFPVEGDPTGAEYGREANIPAEVIRTIGAWVRKQGGAR